MTTLENVNSDITRASAPAVGDTIGPYRLIRELGQGTTSRVFEVEHTRIGRRAAMKIAHREGIAPGVLNRLFTEARAVNLIGHPHVVEITDILVPGAEQSDHALVMELLDGRSLADLIAADGALPPERSLPILAQVCAGLAAVHQAGFVHRDLKPENVFLVDSGGTRDFVKLLDFGLVKAIRGDVASIFGKATVEGMFMGSPAYASPEQAAGKPVDFRTDIYAVGVMVHELVTGQLPFEAQTVAEILLRQINTPPPRLPAALLASDLGRALDAIIQACLVKNPAERTLTAAQLAEMFRRLAAGDHTMPRDVRGARRWFASPRRRALTIAPAALALGLCGFFALKPRRPPPLPAPPPLAAIVPMSPAAGPSDPVVESKPATAIDELRARPAPPGPRRAARTPRPSKALTLDPYR
jgi:serine/threonine-protein kinase